MPYGRSRLTAATQLGDPFLGGLIKGALKFGGKLLGGAVKIAGGFAGLPQIPMQPIQQVLPPPAILFPQQPIARRLPPSQAQIGARGLAGVGPPRPFGAAPKRRRMNPLNVKAVRRSTRRLAAFQREAKKVEKQLRKIAPQRRPSSRRDLAPGHRHIR